MLPINRVWKVRLKRPNETGKIGSVFSAAESVPRLRMTDWAWVGDQTAQAPDAHAKAIWQQSLFCLVKENTEGLAYVTSVAMVTSVTKHFLRFDWLIWSYSGLNFIIVNDKNSCGGGYTSLRRKRQVCFRVDKHNGLAIIWKLHFEGKISVRFYRKGTHLNKSSPIDSSCWFWCSSWNKHNSLSQIKLDDTNAQTRGELVPPLHLSAIHPDQCSCPGYEPTNQILRWWGCCQHLESASVDTFRVSNQSCISYFRNKH